MRRLLILMAVLLAGTASAQDIRQGTFITNYDLDATTYTYCVTTGINSGFFDRNTPGFGNAETSGSSVTVTGVTGANDSFGPPATGDIVFFKKNNADPIIRYIVTNADADTITVNAAVDLDVDGGVAFEWRKVTCGTAATSGWMDLAGFTGKKIVFQIDQMVATGGVDFKFECRDNAYVTTSQVVYPGESSDCGTLASLASAVCNAATGATGSVALVFTPEEQWDACRVGMKIGSADDGDDLTTNAEIINIYAVVWNAR